LTGASRETFGLRRFNEQIIVTIHQTVGVAEPAVAIDDMGQQTEKVRPVAIIGYDVLAGIAPACDVIDDTGKFKTKRTGPWRGRLPFPMFDCKT
jgi:hypothetical protein